MPYSEPVARLIEIGEPKEPWPNYLAEYGLANEHIPELIRMAVDEQSWEEESTEKKVYRNVHAFRALGQLGAIEAARPLVETFRWVDQHGDDWTAEELPVALAMMGPEVIAVLEEYASDETHGEWARVSAVTGLEELIELYPEAQEAAVGALVRLLQNYAQNNDYLNASLIYALSKLRLPETYDLVEEAFAADKVDLGLMGDWEDFQVAVGRLEARKTPKPKFNLFGSGDEGEPIISESAHQTLIAKSMDKKDKKEKKKLKQAKQMRKKNKKKK